MFFSFFSLVHPPNPWPKKGKPPSPPPAVLPGYSHRRCTHQRIDLHGITCPSITSVQLFWSECEDFYTNTWCFFPNKPKKKDDTHSLENVWLFLAYFFLQCNLDVSRDQPPAIWSWKNYKPFQVHDLLQHLRGWGTPHPTKLHMSRLGKKGLQLPSDFGNGWISL